jgi:hypothetical protein
VDRILPVNVLLFVEVWWPKLFHQPRLTALKVVPLPLPAAVPVPPSSSATETLTYIRLDLGVGKSYPFGSTFNPRTWNGTVYYDVGGGGGGGVDIDTTTLTINTTAKRNTQLPW